MNKVFIKILLFVLLISSVKAQISPIDSTTYINGWRPINCTAGVTLGKTYFDNGYAYKGRYSQWFCVVRNTPDYDFNRKYQVTFEKKLPQPLKVVGSFVYLFYRNAYSIPITAGWPAFMNMDIAFGFNGKKSSFFRIVNCTTKFDFAWDNQSMPCSEIPFEYIDRIYISVAGEYKETYFLIDFLCFCNHTYSEYLATIDDFEDSSIVDVEGNHALPTEFKLEQNYPNPFNPSTTIEFSLPIEGKYQIKIFNILGEVIKELANEEFEAGNHKVKFDSKGLASGIYFYSLSGAGIRIVKKMMLVK